MATKKKTETAVEETVETAVKETTEETAAVEETTEETADAAVEEATEDPALVKVKVVAKFRDKYTSKLYKPGDVIEVTEERLAEMNTGRERVKEA